MGPWLPDEVWLLIMQWMVALPWHRSSLRRRFASLARWSCVCRRFYALSQDSLFWRQLKIETPFVEDEERRIGKGYVGGMPLCVGSLRQLGLAIPRTVYCVWRAEASPSFVFSDERRPGDVVLCVHKVFPKTLGASLPADREAYRTQAIYQHTHPHMALWGCPCRNPRHPDQGARLILAALEKSHTNLNGSSLLV